MVTWERKKVKLFKMELTRKMGYLIKWRIGKSECVEKNERETLALIYLLMICAMLLISQPSGCKPL